MVNHPVRSRIYSVKPGALHVQEFRRPIQQLRGQLEFELLG